MSSGSGSSGLGSGSGSSSLSLDHLPPSEQLCYVHCNLCDTVLAVSVPCSSLFKTVTVRCGHCANLLPVNMRALLPPPPPTAAASTPHLHHLAAHHHNLFSPSSDHHLSGGMVGPNPNFSLNPQTNDAATSNYMAPMSLNRSTANELPRAPVANRPPEKRQRVPSAYNRFIKDEIQRIKAVNPDISHREAFSAAAKNWAHFPHIHFGLMPDQTPKRTTNIRPHHSQDAGENVRMRDGYFAASADVGVSPY